MINNAHHARTCNRLSQVLACLLAFNCQFSAAWAGERVQAVGEYRFGPDTAETRACRLAVSGAKRAAIEAVNGEVIGAYALLTCQESATTARASRTKNDAPTCQLNKHLWSELSGLLSNTRVISTEVSPYLGGRVCSARIEATVSSPNGQPDPSFNFSMKLDQPIYRVGEHISLDITSTQPGYITLFNWLPSPTGIDEVVRIFPNAFNDDAFVQGDLSIPTGNAQLVVGPYPEALLEQPTTTSAPHTWSEYVIAVFTRHPVAFAQRLTLEELGAIFREVPAADLRWHQQVIQVLQQPQQE